MKTASNGNRTLDLDDTTISQEKLEVFAPESGRKTPREMAVLFLQLVLRQALADRAVAVDLFHDAEDDCLRGLEYIVEEGTWRELLPAPGYFAEKVLIELGWRIGVDSVPSEGTLHYRYRGSECRASASAPSRLRICIYFTADRPCFRTKGVE